MDQIKPKEKIKRPEVTPLPREEREIAVEKIEAALPEAAPVIEEKKASAAIEMPPAAAPAPALPPPPAQKNAGLVKVEGILEEDLQTAYESMDTELQTKFRTEGERVAGLIWQMVATAHVQAKKILELIVRWLKMIPGVNRYFLEQESKIKTDQIIALSKKEK